MIKRFYLPGVHFYWECPDCGLEHKFNGNETYISFPSLEAPNAIWGDCDHWSGETGDVVCDEPEFEGVIGYVRIHLSFDVEVA